MDNCRVCTKCGKSYPATTEYFYRQTRSKDGLGSYCKGCHNEAGRKRKLKHKTSVSGTKCSTCQRFDRRSGSCMVMKELIAECWAWTDDKNWQRKVRKAVEDYKAGRVVGHED